MRIRIRRNSPQRRLDEIDGYLKGLHDYTIRMHRHIREIGEYLQQQHAGAVAADMPEQDWRGRHVN